MTKITLGRSTLALALVLGAAVGCQSGEDVDQAAQLLASDGASAIAANDQSTASLADVAFEAAPSADPSAAASALAGALPDPGDAGCRTRAKDPNDPSIVIITLTNCTGRFHKHSISGTEIVKFTKGEGGVLHADFHSENLTMDGLPATHTASADITFDGTQRTVLWQGTWSTTNAKSEDVSHTSDLTIVVDTVAHCRTRNGTAVTMIGSRQIDTTIEDLVVCRDADGDPGCPTGQVTHENQAKGKQVTVEFDGSSEATISLPNGMSFEKPLACGQ